MFNEVKLAQDWIIAATQQLETGELSVGIDYAIIKLYQICDRDPDMALKVVYRVLSLKPKLDIIPYLGAGPLEDILSQRSGSEQKRQKRGRAKKGTDLFFRTNPEQRSGSTIELWRKII